MAVNFKDNYVDYNTLRCKVMGKKATCTYKAMHVDKTKLLSTQTGPIRAQLLL